MAAYQLEIVRSAKRKKTISIRVTAGKVIVQAPKDCSNQRIEELLTTKSAWITKQLLQTTKLESNYLPEVIKYGISLPFLGGTIILKESSPSLAPTLIGTDLLIPRHCLNQEHLYNWYYQQAKEFIPIRVAKIASACGFQYNKIHVKDQKKRWGSCSNKKNLNFCWRLILAPVEVLDYVIIHELCHLREMNHSKQFWSLVANYCPRYKDYREYLDVNSFSLQSFLR